jgi:hypothetical protein
MKSCTHNIHQLVFGADWACAHGDPGGLCDVVRQLSAVAPGPLDDALTAIRDVAAVPNGDPFAGWASLRPAMVEHLHEHVNAGRVPPR